jgi:hypothetical protein
MTRPLSCALPAALLAATLPAATLPAQARAQDQDGVGSVTGTLDLNDARWIVAGAGETSSTWSDEDGTMEIRLVATPEAGGPADSGTLSIEITADAGATEAEVTSARVTMQGASRDYIANPENVDLTLTAVEPQDGDLALAGSVTATMTPGGAEGLVIETQAGRTLDGNFQATIPRGAAVN